MLQRQYMRGKAIFALLVTIFMMTPVQAGEVNTFQTQQNDPRQPDANNTTLYTYSDGINNFWSHFSDNDTDSVDTFTEEAVSYTHLRAPRDATLSRMPSSA